MIRLVGSLAHSDFRLSQLLTRLQPQIPDLKALSSHFEYFIHCSEDLTPSEYALLLEVLDCKAAGEPSKTLSVWVVPRFGTQSAWGSKAADILHHVGLSKVDRIERATVYEMVTELSNIPAQSLKTLFAELHDRMTETVVTQWEAISALFTHHAPQPLQEIAILEKGKAALSLANTNMGLALSSEEVDYLYAQYAELQRNPTDVELMMFAQANSEHCRHKIFKAKWEIDGEEKADSLFGMIKNTYEHNAKGVLSAYHDNASVIEGYGSARFFCDPADNTYKTHDQTVHILMKVETHNHPTAIEPFAGAGTGQGGEIRDEGATGCGAKPKAGLTGFTVSNLHIPGYTQPWETPWHAPSRIATALDIMIKGPIGGAAFNNEFGRPNLCGYFRAFEQNGRGYHKPIMLAGGMGNIDAQHVNKKDIPDGAYIVVLGGPALKIGLGGGAASSMATGTSSEELDFASVQRQNPEMERRCQEVIDRCWALGKNNPILSIHDVGAGGLANAIPEIVHDRGLGAALDLRKIPNADPEMSPLEIWCNESQERYMLAIHPHQLAEFTAIAERERCLYAVLGKATEKPHLSVYDEVFDNKAIDIPQALLFGNTPKIFKQVQSVPKKTSEINTQLYSIEESIARVLQCPTVADKSFLITIGDRTVSGLVARDQMVGPWQVPVADCAVTATHYTALTGEAMSMGERPPIALLNPAASARMAVAEAVLNILAADVAQLSDIRLSCNWMAAANTPGEEADLYAAVEAVGKALCPSWDITIPVGKDSLSMRTVWEDEQGKQEVVSPVTLVVSAFSPVQNIRKTLTPLLNTQEDTALLLIDLAQGQKRLGGSIFAQTTQQIGASTPDVDNPDVFKQFFAVFTQLKSENTILAYHDRSDGGLWATLCEMAFATHCGLMIDLSAYSTEQDMIAALFNEELGAVIQVSRSKISAVKTAFEKIGLSEIYEIAKINTQNHIEIYHQDTCYYRSSRKDLQAMWSKTSYMLQSLRDNPATALQAYENIVEDNDPGLMVKMADFTPQSAPAILKGIKPKVAILREQGVNGHIEMAAAFTFAGFDAVDVTMSDLLAGKSLSQFQVLAACGGFSYGDVLGAGKGWAKTILYQSKLREEFSAFFERPDTLTLGVCNGCQMLSSLKELIPGASQWPQFLRNTSEQFEARLSLVEICASPSLFLQDLQGCVLPIAVAHGEGRAHMGAASRAHVALRYVDNYANSTERYPYNPNGSPGGVTGFTTDDGRVTIMMPHPERVFKAWQLSWHPDAWKEGNNDSPWMSIFASARNGLK